MSVAANSPEPSPNAAGQEAKPVEGAKPAEAAVAAAASPAPEAAKPVEAKPVEAPKPVEKYELSLPKDSLLDASAVEKVSSYAKEKGLSNEQAQAILEREHGAIASFAEKQRADLAHKADHVWPEQIKADKEIGGEAFKANAELALRVVEKFASTDLRKTLTETGLGNHPELVRCFVKIGKAMSEDQLVIPGSQSGGKRSFEDIFYGNTNKKEQ
jgi:hypothetical protein